MTPLRVLLIEDSPADARLILALARSPGRVILAIRHEERLAPALKALEHETFDAVLLDLELPDSEGLDTLDRILEIVPDLAIVVSSGRDDENLGLEAMRRGAQEFVFKDRWNSEVLTRVLLYAVERKHAERVLHQSEKQYQQLFDAHPHPMWVYDQETYQFLASNDAATRHYGWSREEFLAMRVQDLLPLEQQPKLLQALAEAKGDRIVRSQGAGGLWTHVRKDGSRLEVEGASSAIQFEGRLARLVLATDVTERLKFAAQLIETQKMEAVGQLAGGIAHDFNNLLTVILGHCDLLVAMLGPEIRGNESFEQIQLAAQRAADLTLQLLTFSRKQVVQPKLLDLNEELRNIEKLLFPLLGENVEVTFRPASDLGRVRADRGQLEQVLVNLAVNARDAMPMGGTLAFATANVAVSESDALAAPGVTPGTYVEMLVSDTGEGIPVDTLDHIFEPFFTTKQPGKGTGLGLATVHGIVTQSGGQISVESALGKGTRFRILLPRAEAASVEVRPVHEETVPGGAETILVVEDVEQLRALVTLFLRSAGYDVIDAADPAQALEKVCDDRRTIHCLLTDVVMPGASGPQLAEELRRLRGDVKTLFMSGYASDAIGHHGVLDSDTYFLQKPFSRKALLRKIREVLDEDAENG